MKQVHSILQRAVTYPASVFWLSFLGVSLSLLVILLTSTIRAGALIPHFTPILPLLGDSRFIWISIPGFLTSGISFLIVGRLAHRYYRRVRFLPPSRFHSHIERILMLMLAVCTAAAGVSLAALPLIPFQTNGQLASWVLIIYYTSSFLWHITVDGYAQVIRRYVPFAIEADMVFGTLIIAAIMAYGIAQSLASEAALAIGAGMELCGFLGLQIMIVIAGTQILGEKLIPHALRGKSVQRSTTRASSATMWTL
jgi:hypothetical protein